ncbi:hypothetical protein [Streptomyces sp. NPDC010273]
MSPTTDTDVIICGTGVAGLTLAVQGITRLTAGLRTDRGDR